MAQLDYHSSPRTPLGFGRSLAEYKRPWGASPVEEGTRRARLETSEHDAPARPSPHTTIPDDNAIVTEVATQAAATPDVRTAIRLGWAVAELRGRSWPEGARPVTAALPPHPEHTLPLRSQRDDAAARRSAVRTLASLATSLGVPADDAEASLAEEARWQDVATYFYEFDARIQDSLTTRDETAANGYLLARGLAECYWGLGPRETWQDGGRETGVSLPFLFGDDRRRELTRMLGRLTPGHMHPLSAAAISGSVEAWGRVAEDPTWSSAPDLRERLYEQVRRWYQLLLLGQDPTTLIKPYAKLSSPHGLRRLLRFYRPQILLGFAAAALIVTLVVGFFALKDDVGNDWVPGLFGVLGALGLGGVAITGVLARAKNTAERLATRLRQDAYTDLVAVAVASVPAYPGATDRESARNTAQRIELAVRQRSLTTATPPPPD